MRSQPVDEEARSASPLQSILSANSNFLGVQFRDHPSSGLRLLTGSVSQRGTEQFPLSAYPCHEAGQGPGCAVFRGFMTLVIVNIKPNMVSHIVKLVGPGRNCGHEGSYRGLMPSTRPYLILDELKPSAEEAITFSTGASTARP